MSHSWMTRAACRDMDSEMFFPVGANETEQVEEAKAVCRYCPVRAQCLEYALTVPIKHGVWGGKTEQEREPLRRNMMRRALRNAS